jgi:hypothetical protein
MKTIGWIAALGLLMASTAQAATTGRVIVDQIAKPSRQLEAVRTELKLTQAVAYPRSWVSDETRWAVFAAPDGVDLAGLRAARDPEAWVSRHVQGEDAIDLRFMIDPDGSAVEMYVHDRGKLQLGASGTMGHVHAPRIEGNRLLGHYLSFTDLFGSSVVIDLAFDAELWQAPKAMPLPADGGAPGAAYLALVKAIHAGDRAAIQAAQPKDRPALDDSDWARLLPRMQAMMPKQPKISGGKLYGDSAILSVSDAGSKEPASAEMAREGERWVLVRSTSGADKSAGLPVPPAFAGTQPDLCPQVLREGVVCGDISWKGEAFAIRHVLAVQSGESQHLVLLAPGPLDPAHAHGLWDEDAPVEPLFGKAPARGLLLDFGGAHGALSAESGYHIDPEEGFTEEFMLRGQAVRIGDRIYGTLPVSETDRSTGESRVLQILRFEAPVLDRR